MPFPWPPWCRRARNLCGRHCSCPIRWTRCFAHPWSNPPSWLAGDLLHPALVAVVVPMQLEVAPIPVAVALPTSMDVVAVVVAPVAHLAQLVSPSWASVAANQRPRAQSVTVAPAGVPFAAFVAAALPVLMDVEPTVPMQRHRYLSSGPIVRVILVPGVPVVDVVQHDLCHDISFDGSRGEDEIVALFEHIDWKWVVCIGLGSA